MNIMPCGWEHEDDDECESKRIKATAKRIFNQLVSDVHAFHREWNSTDTAAQRKIRKNWLRIIEKEITP